MKRQMTDSEVWYEIEQYYYHIDLGTCVCGMTGSLRNEGVIGYQQETRLDKTLAKRFKPKRGFGFLRNYFWPVGAVAPRLHACRTMRRLAEAKERKRA